MEHVSNDVPGGPAGVALLIPRRFGAIFAGRPWRAKGVLASRTWVAACMALAVLLVALFSIWSSSQVPDLGLRSSGADGGETVTWVMPGGAAFEAGVRPGDLIRLEPSPESNHGWAEVRFLGGSKSGTTAVLAQRWPPLAGLLLLLLGLEFLLVGALVFLRASDRPAAGRFALFSFAASVTLVAFPAVGSGQPWALALEWFGSKIGMASFALFFLTTPQLRWPRLRRPIVWAPVAILALYLVTVWSQPSLYPAVKLLGYSYMAVSLAISLFAMLSPVRSERAIGERRFWPVALGSAVASGIYLLGNLLPFLFLRRPLVPVEICLLGLGFIPLGLGWAMLRHPLLGMTLGPWATLRVIFREISDPVMLFGRDGGLLEANPAALKMLGALSPERARFSLRNLMPTLASPSPESGGEPHSLLARLMSGEPVWDTDVRFASPGAAAAMSVAGTPIRDEKGGVEMAVLVFRDLSARSRREQESLELARQKDIFLANVSHDLRTPLAGIKTSLGVVLANEPPDMPEPLHRMLLNIDIAADRMAAMVEDLLELARLQSGRVELKLVSQDLRETARRTASAIEPLAARRGQKVKLELPPEQVLARVDRAGIERALYNLVANAHQHGTDGGHIGIRLHGSADEALFTVEDDGPGIAREEQDTVFHRFRRGENGTASPGVGLGLPIARAMAEVHGGRLWLESAPGRGATFYLSVPANAALAATET